MIEAKMIHIVDSVSKIYNICDLATSASEFHEEGCFPVLQLSWFWIEYFAACVMLEVLPSVIQL